MSGFKAFLRKGVHVGADDHVPIDVRLELGDVATAPASNSAFGTITATANRFRTIQRGARLVF